VLDLPRYEQWLDLRLDELVVEAGLAKKRAARRRKVASCFVFPFEKPCLHFIAGHVSVICAQRRALIIIQKTILLLMITLCFAAAAQPARADNMMSTGTILAAETGVSWKTGPGNLKTVWLAATTRALYSAQEDFWFHTMELASVSTAAARK